MTPIFDRESGISLAQALGDHIPEIVFRHFDRKWTHESVLHGVYNIREVLLISASTDMCDCVARIHGMESVVVDEI